MDIKDVLNKEPDKDDHSHAPPQQGKRQPPPPLTTSRSASSYNPSPHSNTFDSPQRSSYPPVGLSPSLYPPPSAQSYTSTPFSQNVHQNHQSPYQRSVPAPSPAPRSGSASNSYFPSGQRPSSHHSLPRSSTSPLDSVSHFHGSPQLSRSAQTPSTIHSQQYMHPQTPLGPPPPIPRHDSTHSYDSPTPHYQRQRSSSGTSYASPNIQPRPQLPGSKISAPYPDTHRRESLPNYPTTRIREESLSVSPRTIPRRSYPSDIDSLKPPPTIMPSQTFGDGVQPMVDGIKVENEASGHPTHFGNTPLPVTHGVKRSAEFDIKVEDVAPKKPRTLKEPPIWAMIKRSVPPMKKRPKLQPNGHDAPESKYLQASTAAQPAPSPQAPVRPPPSYNSIHDDSYERSFRAMVPSEDLVFQIANFIYANVVNNDANLPLEIEAKVGRIVTKDSKERIRMPVSSEVILRNEVDFAFESQMTEAHHKFFNENLNEALLSSHKPRPSDGKSRINMQYVHHREADAFYELPPVEFGKLHPQTRSFLQSSARHQPRVRVTRDLQAGSVIAKVIKVRVHDLNVFCPNWQFDWRISISVEFPWDGDVDALEEYAASRGRREPSRNKDRLSYTHQFCRIDLTQVKVGVKAGGACDSMSHELEVEMDVPTVRKEGAAVGRQQPNYYSEYIKVFIDNVRLLAKAMPPG